MQEKTPDFQIIARTDAIWAMGDANEALRRARLYAEVGVDMLFPTGAAALSHHVATVSDPPCC